MDKKGAIVTGGMRGIGLGITKRLLREGFEVAVLGHRSADAVKDDIVKVENECGGKIYYTGGNLADREAREALVENAKKNLPSIDLLVNNAGVAPKVRADLLDMTEESFDTVLGINLRGSFFLTQAVAKEMITQKNPAMIVNVSSMSAYTSSTNRGEYCISKAGVSMATMLFADRLAEYGINVYEIRPGIIRTDMTSTVTEKYDNLIGGGVTPIKRWGEPEDIASAVAAIALGYLPFSTGQVIDVDGGFHLRRL